MRRVLNVVAAMAGFLLVPGFVFAQATVAGARARAMAELGWTYAQRLQGAA